MEIHGLKTVNGKSVLVHGSILRPVEHTRMAFRFVLVVLRFVSIRVRKKGVVLSMGLSRCGDEVIHFGMHPGLWLMVECSQIGGSWGIMKGCFMGGCMDGCVFHEDAWMDGCLMEDAWMGGCLIENAWMGGWLIEDA